MDHLPHPFLGQSKTTHHQPHLHRRPRPSALRTQGRLSGRVLRWCSPHRPSPDLRGYLRPLARQRDFRAASNSATTRNPAAPNSHSLLAPNSQIPSTRPRISQLRPQPSLSLRLTRTRFARKGFVRITSPVQRFPQAESPGKGTTSVVPSAPAKESALAAEAIATTISHHKTIIHPDRPQHRERPQRHDRPRHRGRAALQRRVTHPQSLRALAPATPPHSAPITSPFPRCPNPQSLGRGTTSVVPSRTAKKSASAAEEIHTTVTDTRAIHPDHHSHRDRGRVALDSQVVHPDRRKRLGSLQPREMHPDRRHNRGRAALQRRVIHPKFLRALAPEIVGTSETSSGEFATTSRMANRTPQCKRHQPPQDREPPQRHDRPRHREIRSNSLRALAPEVHKPSETSSGEFATTSRPPNRTPQCKHREPPQRHDRPQHRGRAALQRRVLRPNSLRALAPEVHRPSETSSGEFATTSRPPNRTPQCKHREPPQRHDRPRHRGRAALQRRVLRPNSLWALAPVSRHLRTRFGSGQRRNSKTIYLTGRARLQSCPKHSRRIAALAPEAATTVNRTTIIHPDRRKRLGSLQPREIHPDRPQDREPAQRHDRRRHRGRAALQRRVMHPQSIGALAPAPRPQPTAAFYERSMNSGCGKPIPHPSIKPVIAGDTTYGVSLLTGTISGSNFAIP
jgi:hypothetical protein